MNALKVPEDLSDNYLVVLKVRMKIIANGKVEHVLVQRRNIKEVKEMIKVGN